MRSVLVDNARAAVTVGISGAYSAAPVAIAALVLPLGALTAFVSAERLYRFALAPVVVLSNSVQGWVAEVRGKAAQYRVRLALLSHAALGLVGGLGIVLLGPWASSLLFGGGLAAERDVFAYFALAFLAISLNTSLGKHALVPLGLTGVVLVSTLAGAVLGVPSMLALGLILGAPGAAAAFAISETAVTAAQAIGLFHAYRGKAIWGRRARCEGARPNTDIPVARAHDA
ncbi:hypothetical protein ACI79P_05890 [Blastococcus sp. SYSU DS0510]